MVESSGADLEGGGGAWQLVSSEVGELLIADSRRQHFTAQHLACRRPVIWVGCHQPAHQLSHLAANYNTPIIITAPLSPAEIMWANMGVIQWHICLIPIKHEQVALFDGVLVTSLTGRDQADIMILDPEVAEAERPIYAKAHLTSANGMGCSMDGTHHRVGFWPARRHDTRLHQLSQNDYTFHGGGEGVPQLKGDHPQAVEFGQAKIAKLDFTLGIVEDVVWLEIAMNDTLGVDMRQACQSLPHHLRESYTSRVITHVDADEMKRLLLPVNFALSMIGLLLLRFFWKVPLRTLLRFPLPKAPMGRGGFIRGVLGG
ncbi:MAG: hypothetical protein FRX49_05508 [Trebouxia sp. A1-2]|nr:MAG: hypothetical protein FRX49_05508 [Trebouxia sp. A1-2]